MSQSNIILEEYNNFLYYGINIASMKSLYKSQTNVSVFGGDLSEKVYGLYTCENVDNYGWP